METQIAVLKAIIGALHHDQVLQILLFMHFKPLLANAVKLCRLVNVVRSF